jgi:uncharacterized glyoxalase superfamily protein PhnB
MAGAWDRPADTVSQQCRQYLESNPRNTEFAIQVAAVEEVDRLHHALIAAGAKEYMAPADTRMYKPMRFACSDDPFGVRIDIYCPLDGAAC